jgi:hypothetical protein
MWRRKIIDGDGYLAGLREGHTKTKWAGALSARFHPLLTPGVLVARRLKGWDDDATFHRRMELHGYTAQQSQDWYESGGRPATVRQAIVGYRRDARVKGVADSEKAHATRAVEESDIRPEWADIEYEANLGYPSLFQINRLVQAGAISGATARSWSFKSGMANEVLDALESYWSQPATAPKHPNVAKAQNQLWTATHKAFLNHELTDAEATAELTAIHADPTVIPDILALWTRERNLHRKTLTAAQIKKAWAEPAINAATGANWTHDEAIAALVDLGYSVTDAESYLNI